MTNSGGCHLPAAVLADLRLNEDRLGAPRARALDATTWLFSRYGRSRLYFWGVLCKRATFWTLVLAPRPGDKNQPWNHVEDQQNDGDELGQVVMSQPCLHLADIAARQTASLRSRHAMSSRLGRTKGPLGHLAKKERFSMGTELWPEKGLRTTHKTDI